MKTDFRTRGAGTRIALAAAAALAATATLAVSPADRPHPEAAAVRRARGLVQRGQLRQTVGHGRRLRPVRPQLPGAGRQSAGCAADGRDLLGGRGRSRDPAAPDGADGATLGAARGRLAREAGADRGGLPAVDLVSVGVGGNSIGFADIVQKCVEQGLMAFGSGRPCSRHYGEGAGAAALNARFAALETDFTALLKEIRTRAPRAKVAVVGYPAIVDDGAGCGWGSWHQFGTVAKGDLPWLDGVERRLNTLLRDQAQRSGAAYVDTYASSVGHGVCADGERRWMYGIKDTLTGPGDQGDPPSQLCRSVPSGGEACTFVHPNLRGVTHQADVVTAALHGLGAPLAH